MRNSILIYRVLFFTILFICQACQNGHNNDYSVEKEDRQAKVAVLGMLHFVSKNNSVSQNFTEVKSERRQSDIKEIIEALKKYNPTKIAIERPYKSDSSLNIHYSNYLQDNYVLSNEETDQIAFRLGKALNHEKLFLVYSPVNFDYESLMTYAEKHDQMSLIDSVYSNATALASRYDSIAYSSSIKDALYYLNSTEAINKNHYGYYLLSQVGTKENKIGAEVVGNWYTSNLKIFDNIRRLVDSPSERILVIYGQGHCKILHQLIQDAPELKLQNINTYLK